MNETLRRVGNVIAFLFIWFGIPLYCAYTGKAEGLMVVWFFLGWIPAMFIMLYITDSDSDLDLD